MCTQNFLTMYAQLFVDIERQVSRNAPETSPAEFLSDPLETIDQLGH